MSISKNYISRVILAYMGMGIQVTSRYRSGHSSTIFRIAPVNSTSIPFPQRTNPMRNFLAFAEPIARKRRAMTTTFLVAWPRIFVPSESIRLHNPLTPVWSKAHFPSVLLISLRVTCLWSLSLGCTSCIYL